MSLFSCPHCGEHIDVFGHGEGRRIAESYGVPLLGEIEIDPQIRVGGDTGRPIVQLGEDAPGAKSIFTIARAVAARLAEKPAARGSVVEID
jgi:ATP-binding protein involved in chromosome partitioning